jgi:hypothetical protein
MFGFEQNQDSFKFAMAFGLINFTYKAILCLYRRMDKTSDADKIGAPLAGFISSLWLLLDPADSRRKLLSAFIFSRLVDILLNIKYQNSYHSPKDAEHNETGRDNTIKHCILMIQFQVALVMNMVFFITHPDVLNKSMIRVN